MKNYMLSVILVCLGITLQAQTSTGIHHIKYLEINTANSDYSVDFIDEGKVLFATSTTDKVINSSKYQAHLDLYEGDMNEEGQILNKARAKGIVTKKVTKTGAAFTNDRSTVYFTAKKYTKRKSRKQAPSELFIAEIDAEGFWINAKKATINKKGYSIENPTINLDETKLYFSSNLPSSIGGKDLFVSEINADGSLGEPKNLGDLVNTTKDEITPFIADNNFLYFSSNGRADTFGSYDIYTSEAFDNTVSAPLHLDSPINSINDDFAYIVKSDKGYFSSNRLQGQDNSDIYSFYIEPDKPVECYQQVIGTVRDAETEKVLAGVTISVMNDSGQEIDSLTSDENGNYSYNLGCRGTFTFRANKKDYSTEEHIINTANYLEAPSLEVNQNLTYNFKEVKDKVVVNVNPIYFGFDKWNISREAANELDKIVEIMKNDADLMIESASHTDSRGRKAYNQILSERRAKATVDYIVSKGIDASRIKSKGYGETQLLNNCADGVRCSIENHKLNRRTEFVLVNKQANNYKRPVKEETQVVTSEEQLSTENVQVETSGDDPPKDPPKEKKEEEKPEKKEEIKAENTDIEKIVPVENDEVEQDKSEENNEGLKDTSNSELNQTVSKRPKIKEEDLLKSFEFGKPIIEPKELETEIVYSSSIAIVDNKELERNQKELLDNDTNTILYEREVPDEMSLDTTSAMEPVAATEPSLAAVTLNDKPNNMKKKEEALTNASSSVIRNDEIKELTTRSKKTAAVNPKKANDQINKEVEYNAAVETPSNSLVEESKELLKKTPVSEPIESQVDDAIEQNNTSNSNIEAVTNSLFEDEDEENTNINRFSRDLNDNITITDYSTKKKKNTVDKSTLIIEQRQKFKNDYISNVRHLGREKVLKVNSIDVSPISISNKGRYRVTNLSNKVDVMRINFQIDNNENITPGYKEVYILIQNPEGTILNRKGSFKVNNGKELVYTEKTNAYYNNDHLNISMVTDRFIQRITKGIYTITIYVEGYPLGLEMLELS